MTCPLCDTSIESFADVGKLINHIMEVRSVHKSTFWSVLENQDTSKKESKLRCKGRRLTAKSQNTLVFKISKNSEGVPVNNTYSGYIYLARVFEVPFRVLFWAKTETEGAHFGAVLMAERDHVFQWQLKAQ